MLYSILEDKCCDGYAAHYIYEFEKTCDGHGAWQRLQTTYGGDETMVSTQITHMKRQLQRLELVPGVMPTQYISAFMDTLSQIQAVPRFRIDDMEANDLFVSGIDHPDYTHLKSVLSVIKLIRTPSTIYQHKFGSDTSN